MIFGVDYVVEEAGGVSASWTNDRMLCCLGEY